MGYVQIDLQLLFLCCSSDYNHKIFVIVSMYQDWMIASAMGCWCMLHCNKNYAGFQAGYHNQHLQPRDNMKSIS